MILWFHLQSQWPLEWGATQQMKRSSWHETKFTDIVKLFHIMCAHPADDTIRPGRDIQKRHIRNFWHHTFLARNWLPMRAACRVPSQFIHAVFKFIVYAALENVREFMGRGPVVFHYFYKENFGKAVTSQRG